jgi:TonB-linked SusC/RagA family outer membrane protein
MKKNKPFGELFYRSLKKTLSALLIAVFLMILGILQVNANDALLLPEKLTDVTESQQLNITGTVTDASTGEPLTGVNIVVRGTTIGATSDLSGNYTIQVPDPSATLQFSFISYVTQEVALAGQTTLNVALISDVMQLSEVVVVGYGTQRKMDLTGSVATVSADNLKERAAISFGEAVAGQIAGVQIQQISGEPGGQGLAIRVRGTASITQSNDPLYVVDGYPMESGVFNMLSPSDIESIQVLKDASSTAIYGSRGANGVVIITTKKGKSGALRVNLNMYAGIQQVERKIKMMNRDQYIDFFIDGRNQAWLDASIIGADPDKTPHSIDDPNSRRKLYPSASSTYMIPDGQDGYLYDFQDPASVAQMPDNDWQDLLFRDAKMQQYEFSFSGGTEKAQYAFSTSYIQQDGIVKNTNYDRINLRTNLSSQINERFRVGVNLSTYYSTSNETDEGKYSAVSYTQHLPPIYPVMNPDGTYGSMVRNYEILAGDVASPIGFAEQIYDHRKRNGGTGTIFAEWEIIKDLTYRINLNGGIQQNNRNRYLPSYVDTDASRAPRMAQGSNDNRNDLDWVIEQTLTLQRTFAERHKLTALAGYTTQKHSYGSIYGEARSFPNDNIYTLNAGTMYDLSSTESEYSMISYLARVNYIFNEKYLITASFRSDGSSRFGTNNKWGSFPAISAGWRISQEDFMKNIQTINDLKLRASYGIVGNNRIGNYSAIGLLNVGYYPTGDALQTTVDPSTYPNDDLGWEKTQQVNLGFDLGLFDNRIRLEADFYDSRSLELLLDVPVPSITGYTSQIQNIGKVQNRGMEYLLTTRNMVNEFKWSSDFNIAFNKNKVLELGPDDRPILASAPNASNSFITQIGYPIASYYGVVYEGVFMSQEELDMYPHLSGDKVGDGRYLDVNGDGQMDQNDKEILGDNQPIFTAGFNNNFSYKNFTLAIQLTASYGAELFSIFKRMTGVYHGDRNGMIELLDRWRSPEDPGDGYHFRPTRTPAGWQRNPSSIWLEDASYLRIRNLSIAYDFDPQMIQKLKMKALRIYLTGQNLHTFTKYVGYDPETSSQGSGLTKGGDYMGYPSARSILLGVNVTF